MLTSKGVTAGSEFEAAYPYRTGAPRGRYGHERPGPAICPSACSPSPVARTVAHLPNRFHTPQKVLRGSAKKVPRGSFLLGASEPSTLSATGYVTRNRYRPLPIRTRLVLNRHQNRHRAQDPASAYSLVESRIEKGSHFWRDKIRGISESHSGRLLLREANTLRPYSTISSACASSEGGGFKPSAFAVLRFRTN